MRILAALSMLLASCSPTPLQSAAISANTAKLEAERAEAVVAAVCSASYARIAKLALNLRRPAIRRLDPYCLAVESALTRYESARDALLAAIVAAYLEVPGAPALLADRRDRLTAAGHALAIAIEGSP